VTPQKKRCKIEKAFLFDVLSKICLASDSTPIDTQSYGICSDMIDLFIDMSIIYRYFLEKIK